MNLRPIYGHTALLHRLAGALASSRFPQAALFTGAPGVGKQRLALWVAQGLLCQTGPGGPCGKCSACAQVLSLGHPDLHWFVPVLRPKSGDSDKQVEQVKELLAEVMEERRNQPLYRRTEGMVSHALASIRLLQRVVSLTPFQGPCKVIILGDAERLVVQEASQEAANALLKVLEEPPRDTVIILTASEPQGLLPTIRSRLVPLRVGRVGDTVVKEFLQRELTHPIKGETLKRRTLVAAGSIGRALWSQDSDNEADRAAKDLLQAIEGGASEWSLRTLSQAPWAARGDFTAILEALAVRLRDTLAADASAGNDLESRLAALRRVEQTRAEAQANANPQLAMAVLASDLERLL
jgi:DNA polymerase-3 subunit delta'